MLPVAGPALHCAPSFCEPRWSQGLCSHLSRGGWDPFPRPAPATVLCTGCGHWLPVGPNAFTSHLPFFSSGKWRHSSLLCMKVVTVKMTRVKKKPGLWVCCLSLHSVTSCPANVCEWRRFHLSLREVVSPLRLAQFYPTSRLVLLPQSPKDVVREHDSRRMGIMFPASESQTQTGQKSNLSEGESSGKRWPAGDCRCKRTLVWRWGSEVTGKAPLLTPWGAILEKLPPALWKSKHPEMEGLAIGPRTRNTELGKEAKFANMSQLFQGTQLQGQALLSFHLMAFPFSVGGRNCNLVCLSFIWWFSLLTLQHLSRFMLSSYNSSYSTYETRLNTFKQLASKSAVVPV